jgi:RNA polymerase sigma-70 factor, ECF subfamily
VIDPRLAQYRVELTGYCYRMLGAASEAEDAVQETMLRAWRNFDRFDERRGPLRPWLYRIATNVCLDMLRGAQRRAVALDLAEPSRPGAPLGRPLPESAWVWPAPDGRVLPPEEAAMRRETIRLAFLAALQCLPPRQRAVLILRDVLCWTASEVAQLLDSSVAAVNSALQRARSTMDSRGPAGAGSVDHELLAKYTKAFECFDVDTLVSLLHADATMSMPPFTWWLRGREHIRAALLGGEGTCHDARTVPVAANSSPAFAHYLPDGRAFALVVLEVRDGLVTGITSHLDPGLFPIFGLPMSFGAPSRTSA